MARPLPLHRQLQPVPPRQKLCPLIAQTRKTESVAKEADLKDGRAAEMAAAATAAANPGAGAAGALVVAVSAMNRATSAQMSAPLTATQTGPSVVTETALAETAKI